MAMRESLRLTRIKIAFSESRIFSPGGREGREGEARKKTSGGTGGRLSGGGGGRPSAQSQIESEFALLVHSPPYFGAEEQMGAEAAPPR